MVPDHERVTPNPARDPSVKLPRETDFDVEGESGTTKVTVMPDGSVVADPDKGWVCFDGISFVAAD